MMKLDSDAVLDRERNYWEARTEFEWLSECGIQSVLAFIPKIDGDVLELCSGSGMFTKRIPANYRSYTCLDLSQTLLDTLHRAVPRITPVQGNAESPDFPPESFDLVLVFAGLHHLPNVHMAIRSAYGLLRPGGSFVAFEPNGKCWYRKPMLAMKNILGLYTDDERFLMPDDIQALMELAGFVDLTINYQTPEYNPAHLGTGFNQILAHAMGIVSSMSDDPEWQSFFVINGKK